ncbi:DNA repair protein RecN [Xylanibacillus composti]|uniref:DNA repair protein RecN n=1 Tax=Xylanibacillus composti TaxID=1572762 RepID=A0A8J4M426_9BACL|nr:DNA repair protein RecN [Xylanibacillus composti]MDT9726301.1 DNA repair protein RecN [Xylanibacillus composti]GIQ70670.1 DNA repair protein RecN [Xylanibacillus composti]
MLVECTIRNLAVIESAHVRFSPGFLVMTGETGAGKSILIDALSLIAGARGSADFVRHGAKACEIECVFELEPDHPAWRQLEDWGITASPDEALLIRRDISAQGKSSARVNGQLLNLSMLKALGDTLINLHGQHDHQSLLKVERHLSLLDSFGERDIAPLLKKYRATYSAYTALRKQWSELEQAGMQNLQMLDLYKYQIEEIEKAALKPGEEKELEEERRKLAHAEKLAQAVTEGYEAIYGSNMALEQLGKAVEELEDAAKVDPAALGPLLDQLRSAYYQVEDASFQLRDYREGIEFNPERLDALEDRLAMIQSLKRKYGDSVEKMLQYLQTIKQDVEKIENRDQHLEELRAQLEQVKAELHQQGAALSAVRRKQADRLAKGVTAHLHDLQMERTRFEVSVKPLDEPAKDGADLIEFMISPNPGEPLKPLSKIASGGELSRIMLALKSIFAGMDHIPVLIFDEVDTGVSGRAAQAIAEKMARLAENCQVFAITHLPQVACMADSHFLIQKSVSKDRTYTEVRSLDGWDRTDELARMLGGVTITETTRSHAHEMLELAAQKKRGWHHLQ